MRLFESLLVALSTYSRIPVPHFEWKERNMKYAICFFPSVGIVCGGLILGWYAICNAFNISKLFFAVIAVCIPILITGGIHMDGYMDTVDALSSHQSRERKLEILKDSHCGAFSIIYCVMYLLINLALLYELYESGNIVAICPVFVLSRTLSALCAINLPNANKSGMLYNYTKNAQKQKVNIAMITVAAVSIAVIILISPAVGGISVCFGLLSVFLYKKMVIRQFGGVTGDTAGFFLQICELACMTGAWIGALLQ